MDPRFWTAEEAKTGDHRDSDTGESEPSSSRAGRIPPGKHGVRCLRRSRSLPPTNGHDAPGRSTDGAGDVETSQTTGKRFLSFQLPSSTEELCGLLVPFVLLAPNCPWCSVDQPMATVSWISWVSLLFCLYLFFLITSLSVTMGAAQIFLRVSYLVVLGWLIVYAVSPFMGMILLYSNTFYTAGLLGYTLAEHHLCNAPAIRSPKKATPKASISAAAPKGKTMQAPAFYMSLRSIACGVRVLWVCCTYAPRVAVLERSVTVGICLFSWACYLHYCPLNQLYFDVDGLGKLVCSAVMSFALFGAMGANLFGEFGVVFGVWLTVAGIAGFLGYSLALCHCYKQMLQHQM